MKAAPVTAPATRPSRSFHRLQAQLRGQVGKCIEDFRMIAAGDSNKLIARAFDLSPHTVKRHVANILDKLGVQSRGQAAAWFNERRTA